MSPALTPANGDRRSGDHMAAIGARKQWQAFDNRVGPADESCFKVDFANWLERLPVRDRRIAELLATGEMTCEFSRMAGINPARVSQLRRELAASWREFQG